MSGSTTNTGCGTCGNTTFPHVCYGTWQPLPPQPRERPDALEGLRDLTEDAELIERQNAEIRSLEARVAELERTAFLAQEMAKEIGQRLREAEQRVDT